MSTSLPIILLLDIVRLSDITNAIEPPKIPLNFSFQNLQVKIKLGNFISKMWGPEKIILQSVSGKFECGKVWVEG